VFLISPSSSSSSSSSNYSNIPDFTMHCRVIQGLMVDEGDSNDEDAALAKPLLLLLFAG
jgi:hypothetical protein